MEKYDYLITQNPNVEIMTCSKGLVDFLIELNTKNRNPKETHIQQLSKEMTSGNFFLTASGIGVSETGVLLDGQNRLYAMRMANYPPVQFVLTSGLKDKSQIAVDRHAKRSLADILTMHMNITISTRMVALAQALSALSASYGGEYKFTHSSRQLIDSEVAEFMTEYGDIAAEVASASNLRAPVSAALFLYIFHSPEQGRIFYERVVKGINLEEDSPAYRLRVALERYSKAHTTAGRLAVFRTTVAAIIADANGRKVKLLRESDSWANAPWKWKFDFAPLTKKVNVKTK